MNENPEGTPNPLNPNPAPAAPTPAPETPSPAPATEKPAGEPTPAPVGPSVPSAAQPPVAGKQFIDPVMRGPRVASPAMDAPVQPTEEPTAPADAMAPADTTNPMENSLAGTSMTADEAAMQMQAQPVEQSIAAEGGKKKSKKGVIILAILLVLVAIGCGVAAIILLNPFGNGDRVPAAIEKILKEGVPSNLGVNGTIQISSDSEDASPSELSINLKSEFALKDNVNNAFASIGTTFNDGTELDFEVEEITTEDGDMFIKLSGLADAYDNMNSGLKTETITTDKSCVEDASGNMDCTTVQNVTDVCEGEACAVVEENTLGELGYVGMIVQMFHTVDEEWIRIPASSVEESEEGTLLNNPSQCISNAMGKLPTYGDNLVAAYKQNPFINYSTENISIPAKKDTIYRLTIDSTKFANFVNATGSNEFTNELFACVSSTATNDDVESEDVETIFKNYPTIYVEIDDDYNFTRVVLETNGDTWTAKADLGLTYPKNITITEPADYLEINSVIQLIMKDLSNVTVLPTDGEVVIEGETVEVTTE